MGNITTIFWDVGGVLLTNGWDSESRTQAVKQFNLEPEEFHSRHESVVSDFETGRITLKEYLGHAVFFRPRSFLEDTFREFMLAESKPFIDTLNMAGQLSKTSKYVMATLNNESVELNRFRIEHFCLRNYFSLFFSSGFLGVKKPEKKIYTIALNVTQSNPEECVFIDDRASNLECASDLGIWTIHYKGSKQLLEELGRLGITIDIQKT